jgi:CBS domain containing-hemolysin-like protein
VNVLGLRLLAIVALVAANAFFVAAEFALVAARRTRIEAMARRGDGKARLVRKALSDLYRLLSATQLGITLTSILLGYVAEDTVAHVFHDWFAALPRALNFLTRGGIASLVAVSGVSFLHVVFGELVPKAWAITHPEKTSRWVAAPLMTFSWMTRPFNWVLNVSARAVLRLIGVQSPSPAQDRVHSPEELRMLVEQSRKTGGLDAGDARMLEGVFEFSEKNAREVMTPRTAIVALPAGASLAEAADRVAAAGRSRYPVTGESLDDVVGIVHAKDILRGLLSGSDSPVQDIARPPFFVPGTREVEDVLADMKRQKVHLAIVLDEFGGTAGLVTMEDLLEEIVGPIYDEYDKPPAAAPAGVGAGGGTGPGSGVPILAGSTEISDVNRALKLNLDDTDYTTIGGLLFGRLGRLPKVGDRINLDRATFEIVEMDGRRVGKVRVWPPPPATHVPEPLV